MENWWQINHYWLSRTNVIRASNVSSWAYRALYYLSACYSQATSRKQRRISHWNLLHQYNSRDNIFNFNVFRFHLARFIGAVLSDTQGCLLTRLVQYTNFLDNKIGEIVFYCWLQGMINENVRKRSSHSYILLFYYLFDCPDLTYYTSR